jgi:NLI interacting factor-like phosphatase
MDYLKLFEAYDNNILLLLDLDYTLIEQVGDLKEDYEKYLKHLESIEEKDEFDNEDLEMYSFFMKPENHMVSKQGNLIFLRPHHKEFFKYIFDNFKVGVFTAMMNEAHAKNICKNLFGNYKLENIFTGKYTNPMDYSKDLSVIDYPTEKIFLIDDSDLMTPISQLIPIEPFSGSPKDTGLLTMIKTLKTKFQ